ncbi:UNVERIFIED_ORG: hypothetical protein QOE_2820 [Clostridioides difficile F501]
MQYIFDIMLDRSYSYGKERVDSRKGNDQDERCIVGGLRQHRT